MDERYNTTARDGALLWRESRMTVDGRWVWRWISEWKPRPEQQHRTILIPVAEERTT